MIGGDGRVRKDRQISQASPWRTYKNAGWNGFADWLGKKKGQNFCRMKKQKGC